MAGERLRQRLLRRADDPHRARRGADVLGDGALRPARPVLPADDGRDWRDGIEDGVAGLRVAVLRRPGFDAPVTPMASPRSSGPRILADAGAIVEEAAAKLPDPRAGLTTKSVAPARIADTTLSMPPCAVCTITGIARPASRMRASTPSPSRSGITRSSTTPSMRGASGASSSLTAASPPSATIGS